MAASGPSPSVTSRISAVPPGTDSTPASGSAAARSSGRPPRTAARRAPFPCRAHSGSLFLSSPPRRRAASRARRGRRPRRRARARTTTRARACGKPRSRASRWRWISHRRAHVGGGGGEAEKRRVFFLVAGARSPFPPATPARGSPPPSPPERARHFFEVRRDVPHQAHLQRQRPVPPRRRGGRARGERDALRPGAGSRCMDARLRVWLAGGSGAWRRARSPRERRRTPTSISASARVSRKRFLEMRPSR